MDSSVSLWGKRKAVRKVEIHSSRKACELVRLGLKGDRSREPSSKDKQEKQTNEISHPGMRAWKEGCI